MMLAVAQLIILGLVLVSALVWTAWPIHYHLTTGGRWRHSAHGRNLQGQAVIIALLLNFSLLSRAVVQSSPSRAPLWLYGVAAVLYVGLSYFGIRRHILLWRAQHPKP